MKFKTKLKIYQRIKAKKKIVHGVHTPKHEEARRIRMAYAASSEVQ